MTHELAKAIMHKNRVHLPVQGYRAFGGTLRIFLVKKNRTLIPKRQPCASHGEGYQEVPSTAAIHQAQVTEQSSESVRPVSSGLPHLGPRDPIRP